MYLRLVWTIILFTDCLEFDWTFKNKLFEVLFLNFDVFYVAKLHLFRKYQIHIKLFKVALLLPESFQPRLIFANTTISTRIRVNSQISVMNVTQCP